MTTGTKRLCQSDDRWAELFVGLSTTTKHKAAGCLCASIAEFLRETGDASATPLTVQNAAINAWRAAGAKQSAMPFIALPLDEKKGRQPGANVVYEEIAKANRVRFGPRLDVAKVGVRGIVDAFNAALSTGGRALAHVDTNTADADFNGKHWVLLLAGVGPVVVYSDPAIGDDATLPADTLEGLSRWRSGRRFAVRGLRTIHRAA